MGIHGLIEFGNRLLTWVLCIAVGIVIVVARCQRPLRRDVLRMAWVQFWIVVLNAIVGGLTVLARLSPYMVAAHFIAAMLLLTAAVRTYDLVEKRADTTVAAVNSKRLQVHGRALLGATAVLVLLGTVVTGTGVHAGDSADVHRIPLNWMVMTLVHGSAAVVVTVLAGVLFLRVGNVVAPQLARSASLFVVLLIAQGAIGLLQALGVTPETLIVLHLLGSSLIWAGVLRILFEINRIEACGRIIEPQPAGELPAIR
ncbi:COX15/CtaA family protein [Rhodococcus yunnanensis]|uniref:COX15/CtaA family protein n=2 Tax=Rhodococcoides yunnanense TaxID=278209 RepID=A0ABU4BCX9_9NOCA|nr:COX15/CtaA family protein [Rhodococcus yunnanensis]MDV6261954.1 COX15/CtaA family protein [Rhodococcus yunnanensis]